MAKLSEILAEVRRPIGDTAIKRGPGAEWTRFVGRLAHVYQLPRHQLETMLRALRAGRPLPRVEGLEVDVPVSVEAPTSAAAPVEDLDARIARLEVEARTSGDEALEAMTRTSRLEAELALARRQRATLERSEGLDARINARGENERQREGERQRDAGTEGESRGEGEGKTV